MSEKLWWWLNEESRQMLNRGYLLRGETPQDAVKRISTSAEKRLKIKGFAKQIENIIARGWMSLSSPVWANLGTKRGLPISCFNVHLPDSIEDITNKLGEVIMQTKLGGGTSGYFGELRHRGAAVTDNGESSGAVSFMKLFDTSMDVIAQGSVRRGAFAAYLDIDHPDIKEFLSIKDIGSPIQNIFTGVCIPDYWMQEMIDGDIDKRNIWARVLESRQQKGMPYIFFTDNVNKNKPTIYKENGMMINASNLCSEIALPSSKDESFVCCLASMNLALYDEWKDTDAVKLAIYFLDAVMSEFIEKTEGNYYMQAAHNFAKRHRALGLGVLGWHSLLQSKMIPFGDLRAHQLNFKIFKQISEQSKEASKELAEMFGPAPIYLEGEGHSDCYRNTTTMAIAPTTSSSSILGQVSAGIEPFSSNYYKAGLAKGNFMRKNKYLESLLEERGENTEDTWREIMLNHGSVQTLKCLTDDEKDVFRTFGEISQEDIITQAANRQQFIDQSQSVNVMIHSSIDIKDVNRLYIEAWKKGVKTLYYQRSSSLSKEMAVKSFGGCSSCEA